jgi:hypothetical protein
MILRYLKNIWGEKKATSVPSEALDEDSPLVLNLSGVTQAQLDYIFKYGAGSNKLGKYECKKFTELPYGIVRKDMLTLQKRDLHAEAIQMLLECQYPKVNLKGVTQTEIFNFMVFIKKQHDKIFNMEKFYLKTDPDPHLIAAGVHRLDEFGALATIHTLAMGDISKHPYVESLPYYKVYEVLKLEKVQKEIQKAYAELVKPKQNPKK